MQSKVATVAEYMAQLPPDRRTQLQIVREVILKNIDRKYEEGMQYGMVGYYVPHSVYPAGYHCDPRQPLPFGGLASQKNHLSLYLMCMDEQSDDFRWFRSAWEKAGKKLDMGKCCIRFKKADDLALDVIAEAVSRMPVDRYVAFYEASRSENEKRAPRLLKSASKAVGKGKSPAARTGRKTATRKATAAARTGKKRTRPRG
jgi:hypothetical protein